MQPIWYGDRRDRIKWGGLIHLAEQSRVVNIVQVAYHREGTHPVLNCDDGNFPISEAVWKHFSDLSNILSLGKVTGINIQVVTRPFRSNYRRKYIASVVDDLRVIGSPKIVFLDPDIGIAPKAPKAGHVTGEDLREVWNALKTDDILVVYQHAAHSQNWLDEPTTKLRQACNNATVRKIISSEVAKDVALLWCKKQGTF